LKTRFPIVNTEYLISKE